MARRRHSVPFRRWINAFSTLQKEFAAAYDAMKEYDPKLWEQIGAIRGGGALLRIAFNHVALPLVHKVLAKNPGMDVKAAVAEVLREIEANPAYIENMKKYLMEREGLTAEEADILAKALKEVLARIAGVAVAA